jgi:flagellar L-ring protein precursor FlgH
MRTDLARLALITALCGAACGPARIKEHTRKPRDFSKYTKSAPEESTSKADGSSLWTDRGNGASLFKDARAFKKDDLVVVRVEENADARRSTDVDVQRAADNSANISAFLNATSTQFTADGKTGSKNTFRGTGSTARSEKLTATVPVTVREVLGNGQLLIEGDRVVLVNNEEHHFYISGVIRTYDIDQENSIRSAMIADAEIEFTGRGLLTDNQQQGVLQRFFGWIWPF